MPEFIEPVAGNDTVLNPKPKIFTEEFLSSVIKKSIDNGDINPDDKLTFVGVVDEHGAKAIIAVTIVNKEFFKVRFNGLFEHEWTGDNKAGAKVIFSVK